VLALPEAFGLSRSPQSSMFWRLKRSRSVDILTPFSALKLAAGLWRREAPVQRVTRIRPRRKRCAIAVKRSQSGVEFGIHSGRARWREGADEAGPTMPFAAPPWPRERGRRRRLRQPLSFSFVGLFGTQWRRPGNGQASPMKATTFSVFFYLSPCVLMWPFRSCLTNQ
jgi:hypothetical protein